MRAADLNGVRRGARQNADQAAHGIVDPDRRNGHRLARAGSQIAQAMRDTVEHRCGCAIERVARLRRPQTAYRAHKERLAELPFEPSNLGAEGWLGGAANACGTAHAALLDRVEEVCELPEIHVDRTQIATKVSEFLMAVIANRYWRLARPCRKLS
jgi:hypothetical protein